MTDEQHREIGEEIEKLNVATRAINKRADELSRYQDQIARISDALQQNAPPDPGMTWPSPNDYHEAMKDLERLEAARAKALSMLATLGIDRELFRAAGE